MLTFLTAAPRLEADKRLSDFILIGMARLQRVDPDLLHDGLKVFRKYSWRTRYQVVVKDAESAILYINFLYGIGLSAEQMRLTVLHGQKADESVVDSSLTFWKERINISAFRWGTAASTDGVSMGKQSAFSLFSHRCRKSVLYSDSQYSATTGPLYP